WVPNWQHELTATFSAFDAGLWIPDADALHLAAAVTAMLLTGLLAVWLTCRRLTTQDSRRSTLAFVPGFLIAETGLAIAAFQIRPEFHPRYLMVLATPYYLLLGMALFGLWRWWRPAGALAGLSLLAIAGIGLRGYEFDPNFAKDDTRALAQYLSGHTSASDVIIGDAPEPLGYYYRGPAELTWAPGDEATVAQALNQKTAGKQRVVFVQWYLSTSDPEQLMPFLLQKYGTLVDDKTFRGYRERTYAIPPNTNFQLSPTPVVANANFDNLFQLEAAGFSPTLAGDSRLTSRLEQPVAMSGQNLMLALQWRDLAAVNKDYKVSAYLTDDAGHLGGAIDLLLRHGQATTKRWQPGQESTNYYVLQTIPGLMPGRYTVNVAVYPDGEQERLSVLDAAGAPGGGNVAVGTVDILPPESATDPASLNVPKPVDDAVAPGVKLIGYEVPGPSVVQGDPLHLTLFWQASAQPPDGLKTTIALEPSTGASPWNWSAGPSFPTGEWRPGDVFRDWYDPVLPAQLAPGSYQLLVGMGSGMVPVGQVQVQERSRDFTTPSPQHRVQADLAGAIQLLGYDDADLPTYKRGETAHLKIYWRGQAPIADSYTEFLHVLDAGRHVVAQVDTVPGGGQLPTTSWLPGQIVADNYDLSLKPDLTPGTYQLEAGFYRADTGVRLHATSSDADVIDDGILIGTLTVSR
ncbi:MAG: hypothetical protein JO247_16350, partial [Chloroflexi bacterium]|nr:hypothetical protein [Chloroflexota bacterium]